MLRNKSTTLNLKILSTSPLAYVRQLCSKPKPKPKPKPLLAEDHHSVVGSSINLSASLKEKIKGFKAIQHQQQQRQFSLRTKKLEHCQSAEDQHEDSTNLSVSLEEKMKEMMQQQQQQQEQKVSIYRVPAKLRKIDPKSYEPHFISIGPYHHGSPSLQASNTEKLKLHSLNCLTDSSSEPSVSVDKLISVLQTIEQDARACYSEEIGLSRDKFVEMLLLDGCFIVHLFRELNKTYFKSSSLPFLPKRWMLPVVRRDLITLENQLPMIVLRKIFDETRTNSMEETSLEELTLRFFDPVMSRDEEMLQQSITESTTGNTNEIFHHLLDVFHSSITLKKVKREKEPHMYRSITELKEAGIKVRVLENTQPLELRFKDGVLRIPSLLIDNHTGSFLRNIVAYEQCHHDCKPDMTTYLFFLDKLINSSEDVGLLHYEGVIQHSLGSNKQVAKLVNNLCIEVENDGQESYLCEVVAGINCYSSRWLTMAKTRLKHDYFSNIWVSLSTIAALLLLYFTLLQTSCDAIEAQEKDLKGNKGFWVRLNKFLVNPGEGVKSIFSFDLRFIKRDIDPKDAALVGGPQQCFKFLD